MTKGCRPILFACAICLSIQADLAIAQMGMGGGQPPGKSEEKKEQRDPVLLKFKGQSELDAKTKAALERAKESGVLLAERALPDHIYRIQVIGAKKIEADAVLLQLKTRIGDVFDQHSIRKDVRQIFAMGLFKDVIVKKDNGPNGSIVLIYELEEKPTIFQVKIEGADEISEDDIKEIIDLRPYHVADIPRVLENVDKIKKLYSDKGYFLASVSYEIVKTKDIDIKKAEEPTYERGSGQAFVPVAKVKAPDLVDIVFKIKEEAEVKVEHIALLGNKFLSSDTIKGYMRTREDHPLGGITKWGTYNPEMFDVDLMLISELYQNNGFLNVQVGKPRVTLSGDKRRISIRISIEEGKQYRLGKLSISGDFVTDDEESYEEKKEDEEEPIFLNTDLLKKITVQEGEIFNRGQLAQDLSILAESYRDLGYAYANITPETNINEENDTVDIHLAVDAGSKIYFERIDITGNYKTADDVIRRELRIYEGELYSSSLLRLSEMRVNQLGFFETVKIKTSPGSEPDKMIVEIEVKERSSNQIQFGAGYGSGGEGLLLQGQIAQNNLFGRGQNLSAMIQWSALRRVFDVRFVDPYVALLGEQPLIFAFSLYNTQRYLGNFARGATGGDLTLGYPIGSPLSRYSQRWLKNVSPAAQPYVPDFDNLRLFFTYNLERVQISDVDLDLTLWGLKQDEPRYTTSIRPRLEFDQRNNRLLPSSGFLLAGQMEFASSYLGSKLLSGWENQVVDLQDRSGLASGLWFLKSPAAANNFIRYGVNARFYYNLDSWFVLKNWIIKFNFDLGFMDTFGNQLIAENYRMGGLNTVRGYYFQSISPVQRVGRSYPDQSLGEFAMGGNKQVLMNLELEFPIIKALNISAVLFFDAGNVYSKGEDYFYASGKSLATSQIQPNDPLGLYNNLGLYGSLGFGFRWFSPMGQLRFEWGVPITPRPAGTPGMRTGDSPIGFEFNIGPSF